MTRYAATLLGLPWTGSAHAKDIWTTPEWEKREKLASCEWLVTCTGANREHLAALAPPGRVELVYHGIDLPRFPPSNFAVRERDGRNAADPVVILSVGRLVEKKGTEVLLEALARMLAEAAVAIRACRRRAVEATPRAPCFFSGHCKPRDVARRADAGRVAR